MPPEAPGFIKKGLLTAGRVGLVALGLETAASALLLWWLAGGWWGASVAGLCLHAAAARELWQSAPEKFRAAKDPTLRSRRYVHIMAAMVVLFFPVIGLPGVVLMLAARQASRRKGLVEVVSAEMKRVAKAVGVDRVEDLDAFLLEEASVEPILEILKGTDVGLKRGAVSLLGSIGGKEAVSLLTESLSDQSPEVRFYAHATLAKLDDSYTQEIKTAEAGASADDPASWERLGEAFIRYAQSGLVEGVVQGQLMDRAAASFERALEAAPGDGGLLLKAGRLSLAGGRYGEARRRFGAIAPSDPVRPEALLGLCEAAYELRDFETLADLRRELAATQLHSDDPRKLVLYRFWAHGGDFA